LGNRGNHKNYCCTWNGILITLPCDAMRCHASHAIRCKGNVNSRFSHCLSTSYLMFLGGR
jgi:hypothetical protein